VALVYNIWYDKIFGSDNKMIMTSEKNNTLFNADVKNRFLSDIKEGTRQSYERIFRITQNFETALNKDINQFSIIELETVLYKFEANNRNTIESYSRIISSYLKWSVRKGLASKNELENLRPSDFEKYLTNGESYIPNNKLRRHEDRCQNYQDAVIVRLLFMGVGGKQMSEIRNLKKDDVDFKNKRLYLVNTLKPNEDGTPLKYTERYLSVDDRTLELINGAINQKKYTKRNGFMVERENVRKHTDLVNNEYVVRSSITKTDNWSNPVDKFVIYRRMQVLSETLGVELTTKFIQRSGMIYHANNLIKEDNELSLDDLKIVADRFNMKSYHNLKGFLTLENIRKTYPKKRKE
jgi:integrase